MDTDLHNTTVLTVARYCLPTAKVESMAVSSSRQALPQPGINLAQTNPDSKDRPPYLLRNWHHICAHRRAAIMGQFYGMCLQGFDFEIKVVDTGPGTRAVDRLYTLHCRCGRRHEHNPSFPRSIVFQVLEHHKSTGLEDRESDCHTSIRRGPRKHSCLHTAIHPTQRHRPTRISLLSSDQLLPESQKIRQIDLSRPVEGPLCGQ